MLLGILVIVEATREFALTLRKVLEAALVDVNMKTSGNDAWRMMLIA